MRLEQIREDWWIPVEDDDWAAQQVFDYERELYELREWWCRPHQTTQGVTHQVTHQITQQIELPFEVRT